MSSEPPRVATYAFAQLDSSAPTVGTRPRDVIGQALAEAEHIREEARRLGEADGRAAGMAAARADVEAAVTALATALASVRELQQELAAELERDAAELAFGLAEQILAAALDVEPERIVDVTRNLLRRAVDRRRVTIVVNPRDLETVREAVPALSAELGGIEHCDVQADRRIEPGGGVLRTEAGEIDVTLASQIARAREIVAASLARAAEDPPDGT